MNFRLVYTEKQYREYIARKSSRNRKAGIIAICIFIISGILRKCGVYLEDITIDIMPDILTGIVFICLAAWLLGTISIYTGKATARESYITGNENEIIYHMLKSRDLMGRMRPVYHTYHISRITGIIEKATYYEISGTITLTATINQYQNSRKIEKVKIPKYFDGLDNLMKDLKQRNNSQEDVSNG